MVTKMFYIKIIKQKTCWMFTLFFFLLLWGLVIAGCKTEKSFSNKNMTTKNQSNYTITDDTGVTLQFTEKPKRIVSYSISTDEILMALVEPERIAALSRLVDDPGVSSIVKEAKQILNRVQG